MRLAAYLGERFPPVAYTVLVALFHGSASLAAVALGGGEVRWWAAPVLLLAFFHLRVFDEHKDFDKDVLSHPERLLSRGVVTLSLLRRWAAVAIAAQVALAAACGPVALAWWAGMFAFTLAMRVEFGVSRWLNAHIVTYAITHNPVVALLAMFSWASTGARFDARYLLFVAAVSIGSFALEVGRKTRLAGEEIAGVPSYSSVHGRRFAGLLVYACIAAAAVLGVALASALEPDWLAIIPLLIGVVVARALTREDQPAKKVELGASLALIGLFLTVGIAAV